MNWEEAVKVMPERPIKLAEYALARRAAFEADRENRYKLFFKAIAQLEDGEPLVYPSMGWNRRDCT